MLIDGIKPHEIPTLLTSLAANPIAKGQIVSWVKSNAKKLVEIFTARFQMQSIIEIAFGDCSRAAQLNALAALLTVEQCVPLAPTVGRTLEYVAAKLRAKSVECKPVFPDSDGP
jgi:hypothetical protein